MSDFALAIVAYWLLKSVQNEVSLREETKKDMKKIEQSKFKRLLGVWKTSGNDSSDDESLELRGIDSYELILDSNYILHKAAVEIGGEGSETFEVIKLGNSYEEAEMYYFNNKGEDGKMMGSVRNNTFKIEGKDLKFNGTIAEDDTTIIGKWYRLTENKKWVTFIDLRLEKIK